MTVETSHLQVTAAWMIPMWTALCLHAQIMQVRYNTVNYFFKSCTSLIKHVKLRIQMMSFTVIHYYTGFTKWPNTVESIPCFGHM